jgi:uncharacterized protein YukE
MTVPPAMTLALMLTALNGCALAPSAADRLATMEGRLDTLTDETLALENRTHELPQQLDALQATVEKLDRAVWERQSALAKEVGALKTDVIPTLTQELERLTHDLRMVADRVDDVGMPPRQIPTAVRAPAEPPAWSQQADHFQSRLEFLEQSVRAVQTLIERAERTQQEAFAAETVWLSALAHQVEAYRRLIPPPLPHPDTKRQ